MKDGVIVFCLLGSSLEDGVNHNYWYLTITRIFSFTNTGWVWIRVSVLVPATLLLQFVICTITHPWYCCTTPLLVRVQRRNTIIRHRWKCFGIIGKMLPGCCQAWKIWLFWWKMASQSKACLLLLIYQLVQIRTEAVVDYAWKDGIFQARSRGLKKLIL